jgi:NADH dehydrogenase FAD-containing subunit
MDTSSTQKKHIIIVGGSFSGFNLAKTLLNDLKVTIIDKKDYVDFVPSNPRTLANPEIWEEFHPTFAAA